MNIHSINIHIDISMAEHPQENVILGILMKGEQHGYEIHHQFSSGLGHVWYTGISQVYALLKRLQAAEKIVSSIQIQDNRPPKHIYSITPKGRESFLQWVYTPLERVRDMRLEFLAKLFFIRELQLPGTNELIKKQIIIFQERLQRIKQKDTEGEDDFDHLVLHFRISQIEASLAWLLHCKQYFNH